MKLIYNGLTYVTFIHFIESLLPKEIKKVHLKGKLCQLIKYVGMHAINNYKNK